jgi:putative sigma-54 modulation protein
MNISVRGRHLSVSEALKAYAVRRLTFSIGSFGSLVSDVEVRVADVNGPRGGVDKTSVITAVLRPIGTLVARAKHANAYSAIDRAAVRIRALLVRQVQRRSRARRRDRRTAR